MKKTVYLQSAGVGRQVTGARIARKQLRWRSPQGVRTVLIEEDVNSTVIGCEKECEFSV